MYIPKGLSVRCQTEGNAAVGHGCAAGIGLEVTDPDQEDGQFASEALAETRWEFASLLSALAGTFYRCELTPPWRMSFVSQSAETITGYSPNQFEEMGWEKLIHPDDLPMVREIVADAVARKEPFSATYRIMHRSGTVRHVREQGQPVYSDNGEALALEGIIADVTQELVSKQADAEAQQEAKSHAGRLEQVLESTSDCVFSLNRAWQFTYLNTRAEAEILNGEDVSGRHILEVFPTLEATPFWPAYQETMHKRKARRIEGFMPAWIIGTKRMRHRSMMESPSFSATSMAASVPRKPLGNARRS